MLPESETVALQHIPASRPLSSISILADRLKCSRIHDTFEKPESVGATRRTKAVNFNDENNCWNMASSITNNNGCSACQSCASHTDPRGEERSPNFDVDTSPIHFETEADICSDVWQARHCGILENPDLFSSQPLFSTSAPDGPLTHQSDALWIDTGRKSVNLFNRPSNPPPSTISCSRCQETIPPFKCSCRSLSASSASRQTKRSRDQIVSLNGNNLTNTSSTMFTQNGCRRGGIARPVALRISQHLQARSLAVSGVNSPANTVPLKAEAQALTAFGSVRLRNRNRIIIPPPSSRLSWHHPISASGGPGSHPALSANQAHRRASVFPIGQNSVLVTDGGQTGEFTAGPRLEKLSSLACLSSGSTEFTHHRLSAFTPTQSRRISPHEGNQTTSDFSFSPDVVSSPCQHIASSASSGFFQESSFFHSLSASRLCAGESEEDQTSTVQRLAKNCIFSTSYGDRGEGVFFSGSNRDDDYYSQRNGHPSDGDTDESTSPSFFEQSPSSYNSYSINKRCQSQPSAMSNHHQHFGCVECASLRILRQHMKRRRCSHGVPEVAHQFCTATQNDITVSTVDTNIVGEGVFVFGSKRNQQQLSESGTDTPVAVLASEAGKLNLNPRNLPGQFPSCDNHMTTEMDAIDWNSTRASYSVSPQRTPIDAGCCQEGCQEVPLFSILRRNGLAGLSEASEEEELNESFGKRRQQLLEYDTGTLTPPLQTRFRPIKKHNSPMQEDNNHLSSKPYPNPNFPDSSTEGSPCSFTEQPVKTNVYLSCSPDNVFIGDSDADDDEDGGFVEITPELSHRFKKTPLAALSPGAQMQVEEHTAGLLDLPKYHELDIGLIEQD